MGSFRRSRAWTAAAGTLRNAAGAMDRPPTLGGSGKWCSCPSSTALAWQESGLTISYGGWVPPLPYML
eukprot:9052119-Lingulodinium_polyedra.AAC.1